MKLQHLMIILATFAITSFTTPSYGAKDKDVPPVPNVIRNSAPAEEQALQERTADSDRLQVLALGKRQA